MKIGSIKIEVSNNSLTNENTKLISFNETYVYFEYKNNNNIHHKRCFLDNAIQRYAIFELINNSPLWSLDISFEPTGTYNRNLANIIIDDSLIQEYLDKSMALNLLITSHFNNNLKKFVKFDDNKSYYPKFNMIEPKNIKIKLYDYQKKSLAKMIEMEKKTINFSVDYSTKINFHNLEVNYDPIKNVVNNKIRSFKIKSNGGILADEMGLGKTITTVALISSAPSTNVEKLFFSQTDRYWKLNSKATLIVCPSHITKQWENEAKKVNPTLKILSILTKKDHEKLLYKDFIESDIVITSHQFLMNFKYYPCIHYKNITASMFCAEHRNSALRTYFQNNIINSTDGTIDNQIYEVIKNHELPLFEFFNFHRLVLDEGHEIFGEMLGNIAQAKYMATWLSNLNSNSYWYISGSPFINYTGLMNCVKYLNLVLHDEELNIKIDSNNIRQSELFNTILNKEYIWNNILEQICIRHRKCDVSDEIKLFGYDEKIEWITFTELEKNLYESKKNKVSKECLQQLCCHPLILDSCRKVFGDIEVDLSVMQTKLIEHHNKVINDYTIKLSNLDTTNQAYHMLKKSYENILTESKFMLAILNKLDDSELKETEENCSICLENITDGSVTKCGHIYCSECIKNCLKYKQLCPMCKKQITLGDIYLINKKEEKKPKENVNPLIEKYGSKLGKVISMIRNLILEPDSRIIIFSQWDFMLSLIGKTLSENGIANCFVKGNVWSRNSAINKFKNGKTLSGEDNKVIMLSLKNAASGTNLTEATHLFFVEPINGSKEEIAAIEGQAIGRACRLGQKQKVQLYRVLIKDTIEEEIYNNIYLS
jgi:DNA repair protein RAD5